MLSGCEVAASYLLYDLISGGPIFGNDDGDDDPDDPGNHAPVILSIYAYPDAVKISGTITLTVTATDEDDDTMTYLWQSSKGEFSDDKAAVTLWTAPSDSTGTFQISVTVSDGNDGVDYDIVEVEVTL